LRACRSERDELKRSRGLDPTEERLRRWWQKEKDRAERAEAELADQIAAARRYDDAAEVWMRRTERAEARIAAALAAYSNVDMGAAVDMYDALTGGDQ